MAAKATSITVVKGPEAQSKTFAFRIGPKVEGKPGSGKLEVGEKPVTIKLDTPDAIKIGLEGTVRSLIVKKYLCEVEAESKAKKDA